MQHNMSIGSWKAGREEECSCSVTILFAWTVRATAPRWSGPGSGGGGAGRGGRPWCYTASGHWGGALGSITAVIMGLYISTSHHYSGDFQTNAEVEKQVPGTHTLMNYRTKTLTLLEIKTAGCGYLNNCHTRYYYLLYYTAQHSHGPDILLLCIFYRLHHHYSSSHPPPEFG